MPRVPVKPVTLSGRVTRASDGAPIEHAVVAVAVEAHAWDASAAPVIATSDVDGRWSASDVAPGALVVTATAGGLVPHTRELLVADGETRSGVDLALDEGGVLVTGRVVTEQETPIANARVRAYRDPMGPSFLAYSGVDGRYQLSLAPGEHQLEVTHDDHRRTWKNVRAADEPVTADIVLVRGGVIRGVVVARDTGQPAAGARLDAVGGRDMSTAIADRAGAFVLRGLHDGAITIHARGRGYAAATPTTVELEPGAEARDVCVLVEPAGAIAGRVVAREAPSRGIVGAAVRAMPYEGPWPALAVSDADGHFEISGILPGTYELSADRRGHVYRAGVEVEVVGTDVTEVVIEMLTAVTIAGRVEPPVARAQVAIARPGDLLDMVGEDAVNISRARAETDAGGAFTLREVPHGEFQITAMAKDGRSGTATVVSDGTDQSGLVIELSPRASVSGRVVDEQGRPVAGTYVFDQRVDGPPATRFARDGIRRHAATASDGSFTVVGLVAGTWKLAVQHGSTEVELAAGEARTGVTITARRPR